MDFEEFAELVRKIEAETPYVPWRQYLSVDSYDAWVHRFFESTELWVVEFRED